jgi:hypothetical protein
MLDPKTGDQLAEVPFGGAESVHLVGTASS